MFVYYKNNIFYLFLFRIAQTLINTGFGLLLNSFFWAKTTLILGKEKAFFG